MEKLHPNLELLRHLDEAVVITRADQLPSLEVARRLSTQASNLITQYDRIRPHEMLRKPPGVLYDQFIAGDSIFIIHQNGGDPQVLFHATYYPSFTPRELAILKYQVVEIGSVIAHPNYRGLGLGKKGSDRLVYLLTERWNGDVIWLATNKQIDAFKSLHHGAKLEGVDFYSHPCLSWLTCTCDNCSERVGFSHCPFRRPADQATPEHFSALLQDPASAGSMECTLIISDSVKAAEFESHCRMVAAKYGLELPPTGVITPQSMHQIGKFFTQVTERS